jgi:riboflavin synthase
VFTGIVEELGRVDAIDHHDQHARLWIACDTVLEDVRLGDSIAVNGCCLTVDEVEQWAGRTRRWAADLMAETLRATALGDLQAGDPVDLERALAAGDRLGGHMVQGHVDAVGLVVERQEQPGTVFLTFHAPARGGAVPGPQGLGDGPGRQPDRRGRHR